MIVVGAILATLSGACIALSMVLQRYALSYSEYRVPLLCCKLHRPVVWTIGFIAYQSANGLFAAAALMGPLSLLATLYNLVSFAATKATSALTFTICGTLKQVLLIAGAAVFLDHVTELKSWIGRAAPSKCPHSGQGQGQALGCPCAPRPR